MNKLDSLETGSVNHSVYALSELHGPGKGIINVSYSEESFGEKYKQKRIYASQVRTFENEADVAVESPLRMTTYAYNFDSYPETTEEEADGSIEELLEKNDEQIFITSVTELEEDGLTPGTATTYSYEISEKPRLRWTVELFKDTLGEDGKES